MRRWRKLLLPLSWIYGVVIYIRNYLFDIQVFKSVGYKLPVICVGNLSVGGTGKTPMTEYIANLLKDRYGVAILSRGYKRATKGFILADNNINVNDIGDEPFQYYNKLDNIIVAVDEDRRRGINKLISETKAEVVILDDAFQHRKVKAGMNILLSMYAELYVDDLLLPAGNLRDLKSQAKRADIIVITKCPKELNDDEQKSIIDRLKVTPHQEVYFSKIAYDNEVRNVSKARFNLDTFKNEEVTLVTGIAYPEPFLRYLHMHGIDYDHHAYADHHNFSTSEIEYLKKKPCVLTTEKDFVRLKKHLDKLYYLPITTEFLTNEKGFQSRILSFVGGSS